MSDETTNSPVNPTPPPDTDEVKKAREVLQKAEEERRKKVQEKFRIAIERTRAMCDELGIDLRAEAIPKRMSDGRLVIGAEPIFTERKPPVERKV